MAKDPFTRIYPITAVDQGTTSELIYGEMVVMTVTDRDAQPTAKSRQVVATDYAAKIQAALAKSGEQLSARSLIIDVVLALLDTVILIAILFFFHKTFPKIYAKSKAGVGPFSIR